VLKCTKTASSLLLDGAPVVSTEHISIYGSGAYAAGVCHLLGGRLTALLLLPLVQVVVLLLVLRYRVAAAVQ
jgi:hypothetical protein